LIIFVTVTMNQISMQNKNKLNLNNQHQ